MANLKWQEAGHIVHRVASLGTQIVGMTYGKVHCWQNATRCTDDIKSATGCKSRSTV